MLDFLASQLQPNVKRTFLSSQLSQVSSKRFYPANPSQKQLFCPANPSETLPVALSGEFLRQVMNKPRPSNALYF